MTASLAERGDAAQWVAASEWRGGWPAVLAAATGMSAGFQLFAYVSSLFVKPLAAEFGWSRGQIASIAGAILVSSLLTPVAGIVADRRGVRGLALAGVTVFVAGYVALANMSGALWEYFAIISVIAVIGAPCTNYFLLARPIVSAFDRSRGFALSLSLCGVPAFTFFLMPLLQHVIAVWGWRSAYLLMAPVSLALGVATVLLLKRVGNGAAFHRAAGEHARAASGPAFTVALKDPRFWLLALATFGVCGPIGFYLTSLQPLLSDKGVDGRTAALLGSWYAIVAVAGRLAVGALLDRLSPIAVGMAALGAPAVALCIFLLVDGPRVVMFGLAIALFAVANGAEADVICYLTSRYFGLRAYGRLVGILAAVSGVAIAVGGMVTGYMFDRYGNYRGALMMGCASSVAAAFAVLAAGVVGKRRVAA